MSKISWNVSNLIGKRFGKWVVILRSENSKKGNTRWLCLCDCGTKRIVIGVSLINGISKCCGCSRTENIGKIRRTHGKSSHPLFSHWIAMRKRCRYEKDEMYYCYGGRGIKVCEEWNTSFKAFYDWAISHGWQRGLSIERKDVNGNYCPENCCWIPMAEQSKNRRNVRLAA
jgi:hypothetical protein